MRIAYYYYVALQFSPLLPLAYGLLHFRNLSKPLKLFLFWLLISLTFTLVMTVLARQKTNNLWLMNISMVVSVGIIFWMFADWTGYDRLRVPLRLAIVAFALLWTAEMTFSQALFRFTTFSRPVMDVLFIAVACIAIYEGSVRTERLLTEQPKFWISAGLMLYYGGTLVINLLSNALLRSSDEALRSALLVQPALSLVSHVMYTVGFRAQCRP